MVSDSRILEVAGLGFGEEESYLLLKSLKVKPLDYTLRKWFQNVSQKAFDFGEKSTEFIRIIILLKEKKAAGEPTPDVQKQEEQELINMYTG